MKIYL
jgi:hypothetical protein